MGRAFLFAKMLTKNDLKEFKKIWLKEFGEEISTEMAEDEGSRLINLFKAIYREIPIINDQK